MTDTQDQLLTYPEYAKLCLEQALGTEDEKPDQDTTNAYLANAVLCLTSALEEVLAHLAPQPEPKRSVAKRQRAEVAPPAPTPWQRLPWPAALFLKAAGLAMLQELSNTLRRA